VSGGFSYDVTNSKHFCLAMFIPPSSGSSYYSVLEVHHHYTRRQRRLGVMEPNTKLMFEELMKKIQSMRSEMWEGFVAQDATCDAELAHSEQQREVRVTGLESTATEFDKSFSAWKPEVDSSLSSVKCELTKLSAYFDRDTKAPGASAQGVLPG
jgi:hypothetical protein